MSQTLRRTFLAILLGVLVIVPGTLASAQAAGSAQPIFATQSSPATSSAGSDVKSEGTEKSEASDPDDAYRHSASVRKIGALIGLNADQAATAFEVVNFLALALLVGTLVLKAVPKMLRGRNVVIQKQLVDARTATEEASQRLKGVEARLAKLDDEIAAMRAQADKDSALDEQRIKAAVEDEKSKLIAAAEQEIAAASSQVRRDIQQYAAELAIEQAARKLVVSAETDRLLVQSFARRLGGDDSKEGQN